LFELFMTRFCGRHAVIGNWINPKPQSSPQTDDTIYR
jgi:hypothetical protein